MSIPFRAARPVALLAALAAFLAAAPRAGAQAATAVAAPPEVGATAPDFTAPGATRYGLLSKPVRLSDYRGKTVVLAFFYKARTKG